MRILSLNLEKNNGLSNIKMKRLDKIVLIAGKNGSGKSRLLEEIKIEIRKKSTRTKIDQINKDTERIKVDLYSLEKTLPNFEIEINRIDLEIKDTLDNPSYPHDKNLRITDLKNNLEQQKRNQSNHKKNILIYKETLEQNEIIINNISSIIETDSLYETYEIIDFLPKNLNLENPENNTRAGLKQIITNLDKGFSTSHQKTFAVIQDVTDKWFRATHQEIKTSDEFNKEAIQKYEKLKDYIKIFLETNLGFDDEEGIATLFNLKLGNSKLSNGQRILLQLCIAIYLQENNLEKTVIFMDEPENHLHPKALLDVINKLSSIITEGQIWIATHSINLLSNFEPKNIWYMEEGRMQHAGKIPEKVLEGLLGEQENISKLENFISLPSQMATNNFAFECLFEPLQVETGIDDPQVGQIIDAVKSKHNGSEKVKILDFGAGKGRLLSTIDEIGKIKNVPTTNWLEYYAYDLPSENKQQCLNILNDIYNNGESRYFDSKSVFRDNTEINSFDMIILSNVFHEIDPIYWNDEFGESSLINYALKENGILLIIEDQLIPIGEKAYQNGFLVFDKEQFKKLFNIPDYFVKEERNGRLKAHYIEKKYLSNMTNERKKEAIKSLKIKAKEKVTEIRSKKASYENGKLHAFWTQQLANSYLAYSQL